MARTSRTPADVVTTQARLSSVIKESRNIMRKDAGLNGDLDRLPQMAWLLFLKAFDDIEHNRAAKTRGHKPILDEPFRWASWASDPAGQTGEPLLAFVNNKLLPHLAALRGSGAVNDPRDTLSTIFAETRNRMLSGYLLRELVDQMDKVHFDSSDDIHTMAHLYESMLREMRDAAGDSGEFYTPRPLIRFIVEQVDPQPGERVLDPAVGTGGFLVEAYEHMRGARSLKGGELAKIQRSLRGIEKKPMPYLLCHMNLLLHGIDSPRVTRENALAQPLREVRNDPVDVVITNPPFGGEEEAGVQDNFPPAMRTAETSWLFLQLVMARLEKGKHARCGIVVPNGVLFDSEGVGSRIKKALMSTFDLHTVLRLPNGVFAPYTIIPSNVLFFEKGKQGDHVWFYEQPLPEGRKNYTKTKPMRFEEFADCGDWWGGRDRKGRVENEQAWKVSSADIATSGYNLDLRNPNGAKDLTHRPPAELVSELINTERELLSLLENLESQIKVFQL